ncbi:MAG TPA: hypothetical protein VFR11_13835 [Micromonosporaceae bacterium]|jgi:hypothetical protein|nr:hypothetical protein [Micromonosporaceae bacterium]
MTRPTRRQREAFYARPWAGPTRRYDIVKEFVIALVVMALLTTGLAILFGSPDRKAITLQDWAKQAPADFVATTVAELDGTSGTATYGAPYTHDPSAGQKLLSLPLQRWGGVTEPIDASQVFVLGPLSTSSDPAISGPLSTYRAAGADQQSSWASKYGDALAKAPDGDPAKVTAGDYGPVPALANGLLTMAEQGGLDGLIQEQGGFYQTNYSRSLLFLADGSYLEAQARGENLGGDQWGMMNETGRYPGQAWLWLYTFWYQVKPFSTSDNADALVWGLMMVLSAALVLLPFIPGLRALPRRLGVYRLIWREHYRNAY